LPHNQLFDRENSSASNSLSKGGYKHTPFNRHESSVRSPVAFHDNSG